MRFPVDGLFVRFQIVKESSDDDVQVDSSFVIDGVSSLDSFILIVTAEGTGE